MLFGAYSRINRSIFLRTSFITEGELNNTSLYPSYHVGLMAVDNINFKGCTFKNMTPTDYSSNQQGTGIVSLNSRFYVDFDCGFTLNCTNSIPSTFENLRIGIHAVGFVSALPFRIDRSRFINNLTGIYTSNVNYSVIQRNTFEIYKSVAPNYTFETIGAHLLNCTGYTVQENTFEEHNGSGVSGQGNTFGILVDNSGTDDNEIYKNSFKNLSVGGQSQNTNSETYNPGSPYPNDIGLRWKCNTFDQDMYQADLSVTSGSIAYQQGHCFSLGHAFAEVAPAGNKFSHSANNSMNDFWVNNNALSMNYAHHADLSTTPIDYHNDLLIPQHCSPSGDVYFNEITSCRSRIRTGIVIQVLADINSAANELQENITYKEGLIDGGDTEYLLSQIANSSLSNETKKDLLLDASPYLTDEVLIAYLNSTPPSGHMVQIISANSPLNSNVWVVLEDMNVPKGIKRQLVNQQTGISEMRTLMTELNYEKKERNLLINELISTYLLDTTLVGRLDSVKVIITQEREGIELIKQLTDLYIMQGDYVNAQIMLDEYIAEYGCDNYCKLVTYAIEAATSSCIFNPVVNDPTEREKIEDIANDVPDRENCIKAQSLLEIALKQSFVREVEPLVMNMGMMLQQNGEESDMRMIEEEDAVMIFPNPAQGEFFVVIDMASEDLNNVDVKLYTLTGQQVKHVNSTDRLQMMTIDVNNLSEGMYLVIVTVDGTELSRQKVAVK